MTDKRKWFRFHLLTGVLMMFAGGGLMFMTARTAGGTDYTMMAGWPYVAVAWGELPVPFKSPFDENHGCHVDYLMGFAALQDNLWRDIACWLGILAAVAFVSESIIRRSEARKRRINQ